MELGTSLPVMPMNSIIYRITGLMFLSIAVTVFVLIYLMDLQMAELFQQYLAVQHMGMHNGTMGHMGAGNSMQTAMMGQPEEAFLASVHQSLFWVGLGILIIGLAASYLLARSITVPLRNLSRAAEQIERGNFEQEVQVETKDEVGQLALIFNRMADTLAVNNRLRQQLLANIAHELRTPLAVIQGHLEGMLDGVIERNDEQIASLHEEAIRLNRLIRDLRDLSLAEVRQLTLERQQSDVNQLVSRAIHMLKPMADDKNIRMIFSPAEKLPEILVDPDRMIQVFYNILVNALRYSPVGGLVKVTAESVEEFGRSWIAICFQDHGPGIPAEDLPHIFDYFYRADKSRDRKSGGSGLGLAIVQQLVEIHGGKVFVQSTPAEGSIFKVILPVAL